MLGMHKGDERLQAHLVILCDSIIKNSCVVRNQSAIPSDCVMGGMRTHSTYYPIYFIMLPKHNAGFPYKKEKWVVKREGLRPLGLSRYSIILLYPPIHTSFMHKIIIKIISQTKLHPSGLKSSYLYVLE